MSEGWAGSPPLPFTSTTRGSKRPGKRFPWIRLNSSSTVCTSCASTPMPRKTRPKTISTTATTASTVLVLWDHNGLHRMRTPRAQQSANRPKQNLAMNLITTSRFLDRAIRDWQGPPPPRAGDQQRGHERCEPGQREHEIEVLRLRVAHSPVRDHEAAGDDGHQQAARGRAHG